MNNYKDWEEYNSKKKKEIVNNTSSDLNEELNDELLNWWIEE